MTAARTISDEPCAPSAPQAESNLKGPVIAPGASEARRPSVSILIPTLDAEKFLRRCLTSIAMQDYPADRIEVVIADGGSTDRTVTVAVAFGARVVANPRQTAEDGKGVAFAVSTGELVVLLDADNIIVGRDWLSRLVLPLEADPSITGVESNYLVADDFSAVNTYATLLTVADPLARMLAAKPIEIEQRDGYVVSRYARGSTPVLGANGFCWRRSALVPLLGDSGPFNETSVAMSLAECATLAVANVPGCGIYHYYCDDVAAFVRKRRKIAEKHLDRSRSGLTWVDVAGRGRLVGSAIFLASVIGPLVVGAVNAVRCRRASWLLHPLLSWLTVAIYAGAVLRSRLQPLRRPAGVRAGEGARSAEPIAAKQTTAAEVHPAEPELSIIVPTYERVALVERFLESCLTSVDRNFEIIINDDPRGAEDMPGAVNRFSAAGLDIVYLRENYSIGAARRIAAEHARAPILLHLDSDMELTPELVGECRARMATGCDALVIPEVSFGESFWAGCKWLEKRIYDGLEQIEALRCVKRSVYEAVGGHSSRMVFSEDKDLDLRVRAAGARVGRTAAALRHNEGALRLRSTMKKKMTYSRTAGVYAAEHRAAFRWEINPLRRYAIYLRHSGYLVRHPLLYCGLWVMKTCEYLAGFAGMVSVGLRRRATHRLPSE